jgi:phospholipase/carboxylesterase
MTKIVNGASLQPLSGASPKHIVFLLHGYGSSGADLIALAPHWRESLPDTLFLAPNAPQRAGSGYQWWPLQHFTPQALTAGAALAAPAIDTFIDRKLGQYGLSEAEMAIVGFSQGTMMALQVALNRKTAPAAVVGYSGMFVGGAAMAHQNLSRPPVLLVHGAADPVIPVAALHAAQTDLGTLGIAAETHVSPGLGHSVDLAGLKLGLEFIIKGFGAQM